MCRQGTLLGEARRPLLGLNINEWIKIQRKKERKKRKEK